MAQRVTVVLEEDLDGGQADETVRFAFGSADYEIDLSAKNAHALRRGPLAANKTGACYYLRLAWPIDTE